MGIIMINPDTGKPEKITGGHAGLWVLLFGPFYFMWKGMWSYVVPLGYLFYIGSMLRTVIEEGVGKTWLCLSMRARSKYNDLE